MRAWTIRVRDVVLLALGLLAGLTLRALLMPATGLQSDIDIFAKWTHWIATNPLGEAYRTDLAFPPLIVYIFWVVGILQPAFRVETSAAEQAVRVALKIPAVMADFGLAAGVAYLLRDRPRWAGAAAVGILLCPAIAYTSAWWGQFESIYVLAGLLSAILLLAGRPYLAAVALAVALMAKPQALAFVPPIAAWAWARFGPRVTVLAGLALVATVALLWLPFIADGGPAAYLGTLGRHQGEIFAILSLRAWNIWWVLQTAAGGGSFLSDGNAIVGPLSPRIIGLGLVVLLEVVVMRAVGRDPSQRALLLGLAASVLVAFSFLTSVHERYVYGAIVFLAPLIYERRILAIWLLLNVVVMANLVAAVPPTPEIGAAVPVGGPVGLVGSFVITALMALVLWLLIDSSTSSRRMARPPIEAVPGDVQA